MSASAFWHSLNRPVITGMIAVAGMGYGVEANVQEHDATRQVSEQAIAEEDYGLHVIDAGLAESRELLRQLSQGIWAGDCEDWSASERRIGTLFPMAAGSRLFVGRPNPGDDGISVEKNFSIASSTIRGSPLRGEVVLRIPAAEMQTDKPCLEKLRGMPIRWDMSNRDAGYEEDSGEVVVRNVRFFHAVRLEVDGSTGSTGDFVARLTVSEGWTTMVFREFKAHFWGIAGSALLMAMTGLMGWVVRRARKVHGGVFAKGARWLGSFGEPTEPVGGAAILRETAPVDQKTALNPQTSGSENDGDYGRQ